MEPPGITFIERIKKVFVNMRGSSVGFTTPVHCVNPYTVIFDTPIPNVISVSLDSANIAGTYNPDSRSVVVYIPEFQNVYEWYSSDSPRMISISPFAIIPIDKYKHARWKDPIVKLFEYPIPMLQYMNIFLLDLNNNIDTRAIYAELWFTFKYLSPTSIEE